MEHKKSMRDAYGEALLALGRDNPDIVVLDADVSHSTRSILFGNEFPERFFNVGIAEGNMMAMAAGFAVGGKIPFVNTFSFLAALRAGDPVRSLIAYNGLNVKIAGAYSGLSDSYDGASHQSITDIAIMRSLPNMTVVVVADPVETYMVVRAVAVHEGPVFLRLSRAEVPYIFDESHPFEIGKGVILQNGQDVTLVVAGCMVHKTLNAAKILEDRGISVRVIELHTIKPVDSDVIVAAAIDTGAIVTVEEHSVIGGLYGAVSETVARTVPVPMECVGINDVFAQSGSYEELLDEYGMCEESIVAKAERVLERKAEVFQ